MPRQARIDAPDALHHVIARGIERSKIYRDDVDGEDFLRKLGNLVQQTETKCYAWALIPSHFHLLLKTGKVPIATIMLRLLTGYAAGYNRRQSTESVLAFFGNKHAQARRNYHDYVAEGAKQGRRPELIGGGLIRSAGGWTGVQMLRKSGVFQKSDERVLGDGDFVDRVLAESEEKMAHQYAMQAKGVNLDHLRRVVTALMNIIPEDLVGPSKIRKVTRARILFCYWAVRDLGFSMTDVSKQLKISLPTVSVAVQKGEKFVRDEGLKFEDHLNVNI